MLDTLITSKTRLKLLLRFFLNTASTSYLRNLESEFGESTNSIRLELNRFEKAGLLTSGMEGNRKIYAANTKHPLFHDIHSLLRKYVGIDQIIDTVVQHIGGVQKAFITGDIAVGLDAGMIDMLLIGENIDREYLGYLAGKTEVLIKRKISYRILPEMPDDLPEKSLMIWEMAKEEVEEVK